MTITTWILMEGHQEIQIYRRVKIMTTTTWIIMDIGSVGVQEMQMYRRVGMVTTMTCFHFDFFLPRHHPRFTRIHLMPTRLKPACHMPTRLSLVGHMPTDLILINHSQK